MVFNFSQNSSIVKYQLVSSSNPQNLSSSLPLPFRDFEDFYDFWDLSEISLSSLSKSSDEMDILETKLFNLLILADLLMIWLSADCKVYSTRISYLMKLSNPNLLFDLTLLICEIIYLLISGSSGQNSYFYLKSICLIKGGFLVLTSSHLTPSKNGCALTWSAPLAPSLCPKSLWRRRAMKSAATWGIIYYSSPIYGHWMLKFWMFYTIYSIVLAENGRQPTIIS